MRFLLSFVLVFSLVGAGVALADDDSSVPRTLSVSGSGTVAATPDLVSITVGVTTTAPAAREALTANNVKTAGVFKFLRASGVGPGDMQSTNISVSPQFRPRRGNEPVQPEIIGYTVRNNVHITVRDLAGFGVVLDGVVEAGANMVQGISFDVAERDGLEKKAMANAVRDAVAKARNIADAARIELGPILTINAGGVGPAPRQFLARAEASSVPVAAGELTVRAQVSVVFAIE
ncbi:MAG: SIMPL domain-containing protein [Rhodospirillaceae bacterium]|nr:SIMPL domain-containing protein [Rhodospirillaceae bacterium]MBT5944774.1 SIMPL domain-containing protein [Rhodospirillaceae bacterium]MBT6404457.1 SIMPL domain-containing protein [Rhodospirillaceae bacterium]MBT6536719.1 SIMPL domain-containing protein [Rhodospirillaceae bacterium]MBT7362766.1 SIMPL domain-containing protein [Rhodospirillaceae bacterium]